MNPSGRDYSFYSPVHNSYSRINYAKLALFTVNATYQSIVILDHSPFTFSFRLDQIDKPHSAWRLNPHLLTVKKFWEYLKTLISLYFEMNDIPGTSLSILWEAFKAFIRGCIIYFEASKRKENKARLKELETRIKLLDKENAQSASIALHGNIATLKYKYNKILSAKISKAFLYAKQKYFAKP